MTKVIAYKAFNADWTCRGFQYEVGKTYKMDGEPELCAHGFHACLNPLNCFSYYPPTGKLAVVEYPDATEPDGDSKIAGVAIHIKAEMTLPEFIGKGVEYILSKVRWDEAKESNTGNWSVATNTGDQSVATNTGYQSVATNTGEQSVAKVEGQNSHAIATGIDSKASASEGSAIYLAEYDDDMNLVAVWAGIAGKDGIKPDIFYTLRNGQPVEATT